MKKIVKFKKKLNLSIIWITCCTYKICLSLFCCNKSWYLFSLQDISFCYSL